MSHGGDSARGRSRPRSDSDILDRRPPFNLDAEIGVLGSILLKPDVCDDVALILRANDFHDDANRTLFEHMLDMHDSGRRIDITLLVERLKSAGDYETIGGASYLARIGESVPNAAHAVYYSNIVREKATFRSLIDASTNILSEAYDESCNAKELLNSAEQRIFSILDTRGSSNIANIKDILHDAMDRLDARMRGEHTSGGVDTGFTQLDTQTGGLHNSELIVLAARPGMGKTALAMNIAENVAMEFKVPTLFVSLEMSAVELCDRLLSSMAMVDGFKMRNGSLNQKERQQLVRKASEMSESPLYVDETPSRTVTEIAAAARRIHRRENGLGLIVIDYLQLIEPDNSKDPRQEQVAKMTRRLKGLAREMKVPVLCLAQLNRQADNSKDTIPRLSHLRESGAIEQDADVVLFVHREEYYQRSDEPQDHSLEGEAKIIVAKQRNGPTGDIDVLWHKRFTKFVNRAADHFDDQAAQTVPARFDEFDKFNDDNADF